MKKLGICFALLLSWIGHSYAGQMMEVEHKYGMSIQGMYIQAVKMDMQEMDMADMDMAKGGHAMPEDASIHLELRLTADENNPYQFIAGSWIPYAKVDYRIEKKGSEWFTSGTLMPMVANDGPHYGANVKLEGVGKYTIKFRISPPDIMFHIDKETAAKTWWTPFIVDWDFVYTGAGKKGGY